MMAAEGPLALRGGPPSVSPILPGTVQARVYESILEVPPGPWDELVARHSRTVSRAFWEVCECSHLSGFTLRFVLFTEEGPDGTPVPVAATTFYIIRNDLAIFAPGWLRTPLAWIRRFAPGFLRLGMIECGTPITITSPPVAIASRAREEAVYEALDELLQQTGNAQDLHLVVVRDFEGEDRRLQPLFERLGYYWGPNLPNTYLDITWRTPEAYRDALKSYYRSKLNKHLKRNREAGVHHTLVEDFEPIAETLWRQWMVVHTHADEYQRETLSPAFYAEMSRRMGKDSRVLLFRRGEELVGHALLLLDGELLRWLYFGRNLAVNDSLYIYVVYSVITTAIELGMRRVEMGLTTYAIKEDLGARRESTCMALRTLYRPAQPLVRKLYPLLNKVPAVRSKNVFREDSLSASR